MNLLGLTSLDILAAIWFVVCWIGYTMFSEWIGHRTPSLLSRMDFYRREWMSRTIQRENRIVDAAIVQNLFQGNNFLASTSILVLGGLAALLGASTHAISVMASLPLAQASSERGFEIKIMLLILIFVYAFFKFTWAMRAARLPHRESSDISPDPLRAIPALCRPTSLPVPVADRCRRRRFRMPVKNGPGNFPGPQSCRRRDDSSSATTP